MIANELLIEEVKKNALIWDPFDREYRDTDKKSDTWENISRTLVTDFEELSSAEKDVVVNEFRNKWRNIRDSYMRYLRIKDTKEAVKPYLYAPHLTFLNRVYFRSRGIHSTDDGNNDSNVDGNFDGDQGSNNNNNSPVDMLVSLVTNVGDNDDSYANGHGENDNGDGISPAEIPDENAEGEDNNSNDAASVSKKGEGKNQNEQSSDCTAKKEKKTEVNQSKKVPSTKLRKNIMGKKHSNPEVQRKKIEVVNCSHSDQDNSDDMDFFRSLLPLLTPLPLNQKINFRMDVMRMVLQYYENNRARSMHVRARSSNYYPPPATTMNPNFQPFPPAQPFPNIPYNAYQPYYHDNLPNGVPSQPPANYPRVSSSQKSTAKMNSNSPKRKTMNSNKHLQVKIQQKSKGEKRKRARTPIYSESDSSSTSVISDTNCDTETNYE